LVEASPGQVPVHAGAARSVRRIWPGLAVTLGNGW